MGRPVVDSNIIIDHLLGHPAATAELTGRGALSISIVTWIEVMSGGPPGSPEPHWQAESA